MPKRIVLIACVSQKGDKKARARDLYISQLFKSSLAYAERLKPDKIFILSALHHVLKLDDEIEPYDVTLSKVPIWKRKPGLKVLNSKEKNEWGKVVLVELSRECDILNDEFTVLAGQDYIMPISNNIAKLQNPLISLRQGKRLQFLKIQLGL